MRRGCLSCVKGCLVSFGFIWEGREGWGEGGRDGVFFGPMGANRLSLHFN